MSLQSTEEEKEERKNVRTINLIIVTGRCYLYKDNYYELLGKNIESKNSITGNWEHHVRYKNVLQKPNTMEYTRLYDDFNAKFVHITEQLL